MRSIFKSAVFIKFIYNCILVWIMFVPSLLLFIYFCQIRENDFQDFIQDSNSRRSIRNQLSKVIFNFQGTNLILLSPGSFFFYFWNHHDKFLRIQMHFGSWENLVFKSIQFSTWSSVCVYKWWNFGIEKEQESETLEPGVMLDFMFALEMFIDRRKSDKLSVLVLENWEHWSFLSILNPFMIDQSMKVIYHGP